MLNLARLLQEAQEYGVQLTDAQASILDAYCACVVETNRYLNLTAITEPREIEVKHVLDCLTLCAMPELIGSVVDVGTGAGFPGVVLKTVRPALQVTLIDATDKKLRFIAQACEQLGIDVRTVHGRAEELARGAMREQFDTAVARAVAPLGALVEYALPLVKVGGMLLAMKGPEVEQERGEAADAIAILGGSVTAVEKFTLPGEITRAVVKIKKISQTPPNYPRISKNILKIPLKKR